MAGVTKVFSQAWNLAKNNKGSLAGLGIAGYFSSDVYTEAREAGDSKLSAAMQFGGDVATGYLMGIWSYLAYSAATELPSLTVDAIHEFDIKGRQLQVANSNRAFQNSIFSDSDQAYTMRQAGMAIAQRSRYNTQQAMLGNEAKYMMK